MRCASSITRQAGRRRDPGGFKDPPKFFRLNRVRQRARTNGTVEQITGTPPRTFRDLARKNAAARSEDSK
jgi:hypothetical protein